MTPLLSLFSIEGTLYFLAYHALKFPFQITIRIAIFSVVFFLFSRHLKLGLAITSAQRKGMRAERRAAPVLGKRGRGPGMNFFSLGHVVISG